MLMTQPAAYINSKEDQHLVGLVMVISCNPIIGNTFSGTRISHLQQKAWLMREAFGK